MRQRKREMIDNYFHEKVRLCVDLHLNFREQKCSLSIIMLPINCYTICINTEIQKAQND